MKTKEAIIAKEQRELAKWKEMKNQPIRKGYLPLTIIIISIVYLLDALASDLHVGLSELEINYFSGQLGISYESVLSIFTLSGLVALAANLVSPFYKALADKLGRKKLFMISTAGMGVGLLLGFLSTNIAIYFLGRVILTFFVCADIQVIYVMEVAAPEKRARLFSMTKFLSILGIIVIPLCRDLLLDETGSNWRVVCLIPALIAVAAVFIIAGFIRESDVFLDQRIAFLEKPYEERQREAESRKKNHQVNTGKGGIGTAFKYVAKEKQLRNIIMAYALFLLGMNAFVGFYNTVCMKSGMDTQAITDSLYIYPLTAALVTLLGGFISDKLGRRVLCCIYAAAAIVSLAVYILTAGGVHPFVTGAFYGICYGTFWATGDSLGMMLAESSQTAIRSSVTAISGFFSMAAAMLSSVIFGALVLAVEIAVMCIVAGIITMGLMLLVILLKVKETKGVKLEQVG